jgi:hypothetical protein
MELFNAGVLLHIGLGAGGGVALKCALGFCQHPEHAWRRYMSAPLFALFLYLEAVLTVNIVG